MAYYLGLDIGTSGTKALLISEAGLPVASDTQKYPLWTPRTVPRPAFPQAKTLLEAGVELGKIDR